MFRPLIAVALLGSVCLFPCDVSALDAKYADAVRIYGYNSLDLEGPNATSVLAHNAAVVSYCSKLTRSDNGAEKMLRDLSQPLHDPQPEVTKILAALGVTGHLGDSTGAVPTASITEIASAKAMSPLQFCKIYMAFMKREAERYQKLCKLRDDRQSYVCDAQ